MFCVSLVCYVLILLSVLLQVLPSPFSPEVVSGLCPLTHQGLEYKNERDAATSLQHGCSVCVV